MKSALWALLLQHLLAINACQPLPYNDVPLTPPTSNCGSIVDRNLYSYPPITWFNAVEALDCLTSVPFIKDVAARFVAYYNETLQFHSTIAYLKDPPQSYQQPSVDLLDRLQVIKERVDSDCYNNQYAFENDVQTLILAAHDSHLFLNAGILKQFTFGSPFDIVSLSIDGVQPPNVYFWDDAVNCFKSPSCRSPPSPIEFINNRPTIDFLTEFAASQAFGLLEPHADWNQLMRTPALDVQAKLSTFGGNAPFYPGDVLRFQLANSTKTIETRWKALYDTPGYTGPLRTGGDFYNFFALGHNPASYNYDEYWNEYRRNITTVSASPGKNGISDYESSLNSKQAYPREPSDRQSGTHLYDPNIIRTYYDEELDAAVLCIAGFAGDVGDFSRKLIDFVKGAKQFKTLVIDLQQNDGGSSAVVLETFRVLFPGLKPFGGSRMRSHDMADAIGQTMNDYFQAHDVGTSEYLGVLASEWVVTDRINADTGRNFSSWSEYLSGTQAREDNFTLTQQYDLTNELFTQFNLGVDFAPGAFEPPMRSPPWNASNIVLLTDGICASSCALFVEMMKEIEGVKTISIGGRPSPGPMQAASGTRGAAGYSTDDLDADIAAASMINPHLPLPPRNNASRGFNIQFGSINLRDQMRRNATVPNQFSYLPADCRLYWTFDNFFDYPRLWTDVLAAHQDPSRCVANSANAVSSSGNDPKASRLAPTLSRYARYALQIMKEFHNVALPRLDGLNQIGVGDSDDDPSRPLDTCGDEDGPIPSACGSGTYCQPVVVSCSCDDDDETTSDECNDGAGERSEYLCLKQCSHPDSPNCAEYEVCHSKAYVNGKADQVGTKRSPPSEAAHTIGFCYPNDLPQIWVQCKTLEGGDGNFIKRYFGQAPRWTWYS